MKQNQNNDADVLGAILSLQSQVAQMNQKLDALMARAVSQTISHPKPQAPVNNQQKPKAPDQNKGRPKFTAICADCRKECTIPFKPNGDRPVYCQDCFSRRKVISLSKTGMESKPVAPVVQILAPAPQEVKKEEPKAKVKTKKKVAVVKKTVTKKKTTTKRK